MAKRLIPLFIFCLFTISMVNILYAANDPSYHPLPAAKIAPEFPRKEYQTLLNWVMEETDYKFTMIKAELKSKIQYTLRRMDPANQTIKRQYEFLLERKWAGEK